MEEEEEKEIEKFWECKGSVGSESMVARNLQPP